MKSKRFVLSFILFLPLAFFTGCVGFNTAIFMTKSNVGLDFDNKPPTVEINISRKEAVVEPSFEGGKTPPVMASFGSKVGSGGGLGRFIFGVDQTFSGGDAAMTMAKLYDTNGVPTEEEAKQIDFDSGLSLTKPPNANSDSGKGFLGWKKRLFALPEPGEVRPFFFGTDTQLGVKVGWNGVGGPYPDNLKIGFNRKELAVAPVTFSPKEEKLGADGVTKTVRENVVRIPSFLATVDSNVEVEGGVNVGWMQYFATGNSADYLARQPGVRLAMIKRADPLGSQEAKNAVAERNIVALKQHGTDLATQVETEVNRLTTAAQLTKGAQAAVDSGLWSASNLAEFDNYNATEQGNYLKRTAEGRGSPEDIQKLGTYLEGLKAIR